MSNKKWSIDISYLFCKDGLSYICAIKDMCDKSIVSWVISRFIDHRLVMDTLGQAIKNAPLEKILIETDAPYVAPIPYRGNRNEPIYVKEVAKKIAQIKKLPLKKIEEATFKNTLRLFRI